MPRVLARRVVAIAIAMVVVMGIAAGVLLTSSRESSANDVKAWGIGLTTNPGAVGQCTYGAEIKWHDYVIGHLPPGSPPYMDPFGHNTADAQYWADNAAANGWTVVSTPQPNSIAVFPPNAQGAGSIGHVAWVTDVTTSSITIVEMNFNNGGIGGFNQWDMRTLTPAPSLRYILAP